MKAKLIQVSGIRLSSGLSYASIDITFPAPRREWNSSALGIKICGVWLLTKCSSCAAGQTYLMEKILMEGSLYKFFYF